MPSLTGWEREVRQVLEEEGLLRELRQDTEILLDEFDSWWNIVNDFARLVSELQRTRVRFTRSEFEDDYEMLVKGVVR
ncbi:MAG: hypothetical protein QW320_06755, partial [Ignisphaera sp.]